MPDACLEPCFKLGEQGDICSAVYFPSPLDLFLSVARGPQPLGLDQGEDSSQEVLTDSGIPSTWALFTAFSAELTENQIAVGAMNYCMYLYF